MNGKRPKGKLDPATFAFESVMSQVQPQKPEKHSVFLRPDVLPRLQELQQILDGKPPAAGDVERSIGDAVPNDPDELLAEFNELATVWNDSEVVFEIRPTNRTDRTTVRAAMKEAGADPDDDPEDVGPCYVLAQACVSHRWTPEQWLEFRDAIGEAVFLPLYIAVGQANLGVGVTAPFSLRHSTGPTTEK